jgi:ABC-type transport system involved in multi-copper enzyme maturation permease subunit
MIRAAAAFAGLTLRSLAAGKRAPAAALLLLLGPLLALLAALLGKKAQAEPIFQQVVFNYSLGFMIYLLSLVYGIALSSGEIEDGTVGYLYLGRLPRWLIVLVQAGVATLALTAGVFLSVLLTGLAAGLAEGDLPRLWRDAAACTLVGGTGVLVALPFYMVCGLCFRTPLGALTGSLAPTLFWELMVTGWPIKFAAWTVTNNLRGLLLELLFDGRPGPLFKYVRNFQLPGYGEASMYLSVLAGLFLVAAMVAAMNRSIEGKEAR